MQRTLAVAASTESAVCLAPKAIIAGAGAGGMPALTLPFVLVAWVFILASPQCRRLRRAAVNADG